MLIGIIGGTGLGDELSRQPNSKRIDCDTPFGPPSAPLLRGSLDGVDVVFLNRHGTGHTISPTGVPYRANIFALKSVGVTHVIASGAVGSLRENIAPADLVICDQVIDRTYRRDKTFFDHDIAAHVELSDPFCPHLRQVLLGCASSVDTKVHDKGVYVVMEGPQFSTRAESNMHRQMGGDLIGMTCMPEAKLAREAELCYALVALPTDYDCWRPHEAADKQTLLAEIIGHLKSATANAIALIRSAVKRLGDNPPPTCACQSALEMAIWSDKGQVNPNAIRRLQPIVGRYFEGPSA